MFETSSGSGWKALRNPFQGWPETGELITSHVSGRSTDIREIIIGGQNAIILSGAPQIGKTSLIRYLRRASTIEWSWRDELAYLHGDVNLADIHFTEIDLAPLEEVTEADALLDSFIKQCVAALQLVWRQEDIEYAGRKGLRELLRRITCEHPSTSYFVMLDTIERLQGLDIPLLNISNDAQTPQDRAMELLDDCGIIHLLVDLLDKFPQFGVILSVKSRPLPESSKQFIHNSLHISSDLARFRTMALQTFTYDDTMHFLAQKPESFGLAWERQFKDAGGSSLFAESEQRWLYEQAGTHPYLLQQYCFHTFHLKREYAIRQGSWTELKKSDQDQLIERVKERVSTFLNNTWNRVKEALDSCSPDTRDVFYSFIGQSREKQAIEKLEPKVWKDLGEELHYILYSEGIVRSDPSQPVYYPGSMLLRYLGQKAQEQGKLPTRATLPQPLVAMSHTSELLISPPDKQAARVKLTPLEYRLMKTLLQHPQKCTEEELMKAAWGKIIEKPVLTQRIFQLRKKLWEHSGGEEIIENRYGGHYLLRHADWLQMLS